ncbi:MAG: TatD family hydrolase [Lachnospiraceae bacterium]|nr:TatD family hydrolase [Lachnospiraceae bacterium]
MIFDTHTHYDHPGFDPDREALLEELPEKGILAVVNIGANLKGSERSLELAQKRPYILAAAGVHPDDVRELEELGEEEAERALKPFLSHPRCVALGEIGLDYHGDYPDKTSRPLQQKWFRFQLNLMKETGLPGIIHSREAAADTLKIIREAGGAALPLVHHCFGYEKEMAKIYLDMGHYLGIGGVLTFKNGRKLKEVVQYMPADRILLETDCPYLAPEPFRGRRNDSRLLSYVIREVAALKGMDPEEVEALTVRNALEFYRLTESFVHGTISGK